MEKILAGVAQINLSVPELDDNLIAIARKFDATTFLDWIQKALSRNILKSQDFITGECTLFLPTNRAIATIPSSMRSDPFGSEEHLKKFILYHVSPQVLSWDSVSDNSFMPSALPDEKIRCNFYHRDVKPDVLTVSGCRVLALEPLQGDSNATVAVLDEAMLLPKGSSALTIAESPMLTNFSKILEVADSKGLLSKGGLTTIFAPHDCAFAEMDPEVYQRLITNKEIALEFVKQYIVNGCLFSSGLYTGQTLFTEAFTRLILRVTPPDCILISKCKLLYCDWITTDGVVHILGSLLPL